jgi:tyrosyl-tRNA synthetase
MGKSLSNWIGITEPADEQFGKVMSIPDTVVVRYAELASGMSPPEIAEIRRLVGAGGGDANRAKRAVARAIAALYHGPDAADAAEKAFNERFVDHGVPQDAPDCPLPPGDPVHLPAVLVDAGLASSRSEARRFIDDGAVRLDGEPVQRGTYDMARDRVAGRVAQRGRRKAARLVG